jgi:AcrR family transcriptional regulator
LPDMAVPTSAPTGRYGGVSADQRRSERRERLLEAALELLGSEGWKKTTVRGVCATAGLNPRYFYESFEDLDSLLVAVFNRIAAGATERIVTAYAGAPADGPAKARAAIEAAVHYLTDDPRRARVAFVEGLGNEAVMRRRLDVMDDLSRLLAAYARALYGMEEARDPIGDVASTLLVGGILELLITWLDGRLHMTREHLIDDMVELFVLTGEGAVAIARRRANARR